MRKLLLNVLLYALFFFIFNIKSSTGSLIPDPEGCSIRLIGDAECPNNGTGDSINFVIYANGTVFDSESGQGTYILYNNTAPAGSYSDVYAQINGSNTGSCPLITTAPFTFTVIDQPEEATLTSVTWDNSSQQLTVQGTCIVPSFTSLTLDIFYIDDTDTYVQIGSTTLSENSTSFDYSFAPNPTLSPGTYTIVVNYGLTQVYSAGTYKCYSDYSNTKSINTITPPTITSVTQNCNVTDNNATLTVVGTGEADASITVYNNTNQIGTGTADGDGNWTVVTNALNNGDSYSVTATQTTSDGTSPNSSPVFTGTIAVSSAPSIGSITVNNIVSCANLNSLNTLNVSGPATTGDTVNLYFDGSKVQTTTATANAYSFTYAISDPTNTHTVYVTQTNSVNCESAPSATQTILYAPIISTVTVTDCNMLTVTGTAIADNLVLFYLNGVKTTGNTTADGSGNYSFSEAVSSPGTYCLTVAQTDHNADISTYGIWGGSENPTQIIVDSVPSGTPTISSLIYTNATSDGIANLNNWTIEGTVTVGDSISIALNGSTVTTQTPSSSPYSYSSSSPVTISQANTFKVTETTPNSGCTNSAQITTPVAPTNIVVDSSQCGTFRVTGSGTANATAQIYLNGSPTTSATIGSNGLFDTGYVDTAPGSYYVTVAQVVSSQYSPYAVGNSGMAINITSSTITVPNITDLEVLYTPVKNKITVTGTAIAGNTISLYDGTTLLNAIPVTVDSSGNYSVTSDNALSTSSHTITTTQYDTVQNCSSASSDEWDMEAAPVLVSAAYAGNGLVTISGTAATNGYIKIFANGIAISDAISVSNAFSNISSTIPITSPGTYDITAQFSLDVFRAVNTNSVFSDPITVFVPANSPVINTIIPNCDGSLTLRGSSNEPNSTVTIYVDSVSVATGATDSNGYFTVTTPALSVGTHVIQAKTPSSPISQAYVVVIVKS